jgi:hypothetical protein
MKAAFKLGRINLIYAALRFASDAWSPAGKVAQLVTEIEATAVRRR